MVEDDIKAKLGRIFKVPVTLDEPGEAEEQEKIFVDIQSNQTNIKDGRIVGRVTCEMLMVGQESKMPIDFIPKMIARAESDDKDHFFFDYSTQSQRIFRNIVQRSLTFVYFFNGQYDPETGSIDSITTTTEVQ